MKLIILVSLVLLMLAAQTTPPIAISSPLAGDVLRGQVTITGTTDIPNFLSAQLDFSYASNPQSPDALSGDGNWFTLQALSQPVLDSTLATWDTTTISDGDYILRLHVNLSDGTSQEVTVQIQNRHDSPIPQLTKTATSTPDFLTI